MSKNVKPIKVIKTRLENILFGTQFTLDGVRYVKLADQNNIASDLSNGGVLATTELPLCEFDSASRKSNKSIEERVVELFIAATSDIQNKNIITYGIPDADDIRKYCFIMHPHIKDIWYVDNGVHDALNEGEYFYVDELCNLNKGNEYDERGDGVSRRLCIRAFYSIDPDALVTVECEQERTFNMETLSDYAKKFGIAEVVNDMGEHRTTKENSIAFPNGWVASIVKKSGSGENHPLYSVAMCDYNGYFDWKILNEYGATDGCFHCDDELDIIVACETIRRLSDNS